MTANTSPETDGVAETEPVDRPPQGSRRAFPSPSAAAEVARVDLLRGYRWAWMQDFWLAYSAGTGIVMLAISWFTFNVGRDIGLSLSGGDPVPLSFWMAWSVVAVFLLGLLVWSGVSEESNLDNSGHYLTIRPVSDVVVGLLLAAICKFSAFIVLPATTAGVGIALETGSGQSILGFIIASVFVLLNVVAIGYPFGLVLKGSLRRSSALTRYKSVVAFTVGAAYLILVFTGLWLTIVDLVEPILTGPPLSWYGDLALVTSPGSEVAVHRAASAIVFAGGVTIFGFACATPAARYAWTTDRTHPVDVGESEETNEGEVPRPHTEAIFAPICRRSATLSVASTTVLRLYRAPQQLVFVVFPLLAVIPAAERVLTTGTLPWYAPWFVVWYGAWGAGTAVGLNPLGNQGATLTTLLTSSSEGRQIVNGHIVTSVPVAAVTAALAFGSGVLAGYPTIELIAFAVFSVAGTIGGTALALGIGTLFPRFESIDLGRSTRAIPPSKLAYVCFSAILTVLIASVAVVADNTVQLVVVSVLSSSLPLDSPPIESGVRAISLLCIVTIVGSAPLAYRFASRRIDHFRLN